MERESHDRTYKTDGDSTLLYNAILNGNEQEALNVLASGAAVKLNNQNGKTVLHLACELLKEEVVDKILERDIDVNVKDTTGNTALHVIAKTTVSCFGAAYNVLRSKLEAIAVKLLSKGVDINTQNMFGQTALHCACEKHNKDTVKVLLDSGADPNIKNSNGETPLLVVDGHSEITRMLLEKGANVHAQNSDGCTAVHLLVNVNYSGHRPVFAELLVWGGSVFTLDENGEQLLNKLIDPKRNHLLLKPLVEYITALECANLDWSKYAFVKSIVPFENYFSPRQAYFQIENIKKVKCGSFSLYDIFSTHRDPTKLVTDKNLVELVKKATFKLDYVDYGSLLKAKFVDAQKRYKKLVDSHYKFMTALPNEVTWKILTFLEDEDLESVTRAVKF